MLAIQDQVNDVQIVRCLVDGVDTGRREGTDCQMHVSDFCPRVIVSPDGECCEIHINCGNTKN